MATIRDSFSLVFASLDSVRSYETTTGDCRRNVVAATKKTETFTDQLNGVLQKLTDCKNRTAQQIANDTELAIQRFRSGRRQDAMKLMRAVHKNKLYQEYITAAHFELLGMRIELASNHSNQIKKSTTTIKQTVPNWMLLTRLSWLVYRIKRVNCTAYWPN